MIQFFGIGAGKVISGVGDDNITVAANATGNSDITTGDGVDIITLSAQSGIDIVRPGGTSININNKTQIPTRQFYQTKSSILIPIQIN